MKDYEFKFVKDGFGYRFEVPEGSALTSMFEATIVREGRQWRSTVNTHGMLLSSTLRSTLAEAKNSVIYAFETIEPFYCESVSA